MNLNEYQSLALRTAKMFPTMALNLSHSALGLATEFMELQPLSAEVSEETGDYCWYIALGCHALDLKLGDLFGETVDAAYVQSLGAEHMTLSGLFRDGCSVTGNFITMVKRVAIYAKELTPEMREQAKVDIVGMMKYAGSVASYHGFTLALCLRNNIAKLRARFPDKYSDDAAEARADKGGVDARNS